MVSLNKYMSDASFKFLFRAALCTAITVENFILWCIEAPPAGRDIIFCQFLLEQCEYKQIDKYNQFYLLDST